MQVRTWACNPVSKKIMSKILFFLGQTMQELSKDKPNDRSLDKYTSTFLQNLDEAETELATQINYLSQVIFLFLSFPEMWNSTKSFWQVATNQQHEGSSYAARKQAQLLHEAIAQISKQVNEMTTTCKPNSWQEAV